jgi:hypothetical protein
MSHLAPLDSALNMIKQVNPDISGVGQFIEG